MSIMWWTRQLGVEQGMAPSAPGSAPAIIMAAPRYATPVFEGSGATDGRPNTRSNLEAISSSPQDFGVGASFVSGPFGEASPHRGALDLLSLHFREQRDRQLTSAS